MTSPDPFTHDGLVARTEEYVRERMAGDSTGHDFWHALRVCNMALRLGRAEGLNEAELETVEIAALLHDVEDEKFSGSPSAGPDAAQAFLLSQGRDRIFAEAVADIIARISFHGGGVEDSPLSLAGQCVRDADRLDAMGAIGIARAFAYGGHAGRPIHDPNIAPMLAKSKDAYRANGGSTISHFYEKLLLLRDRMSTASGRALAQERHQVMANFLAHFGAEWRGKDGEDRP